MFKVHIFLLPLVQAFLEYCRQSKQDCNSKDYPIFFQREIFQINTTESPVFFLYDILNAN